MSRPNYAPRTVCRPSVVSVPDRPEGAEQATCPYCLCAVWKMPIEQLVLPGSAEFACTDCAFKRGLYQARMDAERFAREQQTITSNGEVTS